MSLAPHSDADVDAPVVIVGGGPVGVTAATLLGQYGISCLVLDRWDGVYPQPRAVHLDDEVYRILNRVGVATDFAALSRPTQGLQLVDREHRVLAVFSRGKDLGRHGYPPANLFDQPDLEELLRANLKRQDTVTFRGNVEVTEVAQDGHGRVRVGFTDRLTEKTESVTARYVLGCDGANSIVRRVIGTTMQDLGFKQRWLVVDIATTAELDQWEGVHQICDTHRAATFMRIGETRYRWEFRLLPGETAAEFETLDALRALLDPWIGAVANDELQVVRVAEYTFRAQIADRWRAGNIFLLGDAAHLTPPFIGQGLCAGIRDAMNLSWKLAGVVSGDLEESALDTYEVERPPHVRAIIRLAKLVGISMTQGGRAGDAIRHLVVPRLHWLPGLRERLLDSETAPLHRSSLVLRRPLGRSLAGRQCPNAPLEGGGRLDDVLGIGFAVISVVPLAPEDRAVVEQRGAVVIDATMSPELEAWLAAGRAKVVVVRPDFTVVCAAGDVAEAIPAVPTFGFGSR